METRHHWQTLPTPIQLLIAAEKARREKQAAATVTNQPIRENPTC